MKTLRAKTLRAQRVMSTKIKTSQIFPTKNTMFTANSIDFDGDGHFSGSDLGTLSNKYFFELYTIGDGHCFLHIFFSWIGVADFQITPLSRYVRLCTVYLVLRV